MRIQSAIRREAQNEIPDKTRLDSLASELDNNKKAYGVIREKIAVDFPAYASFTGIIEPLTLKEVQEGAIRENEVLLEYVVSDSGCFVFVVKSDTMDVLDLDLLQEDLDEMVTALRTPFSELKNVMDINYDLDLAHELYLKLFAPAEKYILPENHVVVIPDGMLYYLPFDALVTQLKHRETEDVWYSEYRNVEYLIERYAISYSLSASLLDPKLMAGKQNKQNLKGRLFAVGNPNYQTLGGDVIELRGSLGWKFEPLTYSAEEVESIGEIMGNSKIYLAEEATEKNVKKEAYGYEFLHFSTHGLLDEKQPLYSGIVLTYDDSDTDDGFLQAYEIINLDLNADLVTLSACETGLGKLRRGEGIIGLTRAFMYAGARSVLVSLWSVYDPSTTRLMITFYKDLKKGLNHAQSLRQAKLQLMQKTTEKGGKEISYSHPFFWAPFVIMGQADAEFDDRGLIRSQTWVVGFIVLGLSMLLLFLFTRRFNLKGGKK
jgi:CHAT domain-containing protein